MRPDREQPCPSTPGSHSQAVTPTSPGTICMPGGLHEEKPGAGSEQGSPRPAPTAAAGTRGTGHRRRWAYQSPTTFLHCRGRDCNKRVGRPLQLSLGPGNRASASRGGRGEQLEAGGDGGGHLASTDSWRQGTFLSEAMEGPISVPYSHQLTPSWWWGGFLTDPPK